MTCREARNLVSSYLDGRLAGRRARDLTQHLDECAGCREELARLRFIADAVRSLPAAHLTVDLTPAVMARASAPRRWEWLDALKRSAAYRPPRVIPEFARVAVVVVALVVVVTAGAGQGPGNLVASWAGRVAGIAGTGVAQLTSGLAEARILLAERFAPASLSATAQAPAREHRPELSEPSSRRTEPEVPHARQEVVRDVYA